MDGFFTQLFDTSDFPARWNCGVWTPAHGWLHILSDLATFAAYTAIPCVLAYFILRRSDLVFPKIFWLFCIFIFACGTVHLIEATIFWQPWYRLSGLVKLITAIVSWVTVLGLIRIAPSALRLPSLAIANETLQDEIQARKRSEDRLRDYATELEQVNEDLDHFNRTMLDREDRVLHLKSEVNQLLLELGREPRYKKGEQMA